MENIFLINEDYYLEFFKLFNMSLDSISALPSKVNEAKAEVVSQTGSGPKSKSVAVLSLNGSIQYKASALEKLFFGAVSLSELSIKLDELVFDDSIGTIILNIDSGGGVITGVPEFADKIYSYRKKKRIVGFSNPMACSAAYWIGSACQEFYSLGSGLLGSVGVYCMHLDISKMLENDGVKATFIKAGEKKTDGNYYEPLSASAKKDMQKQVDEIYDAFVSSIALYRGTNVDDVLENFGKGSVVTPKNALNKNMIDGIMNMDELIASELSNLQEKDSSNSLTVNRANMFLNFEGLKQ